MTKVETMRSHRDVFIGRERELSLLGGLATRRHKRPLFIDGEAGMGKTRLVEEFAARALETGTLVVQGRCYPSPDRGPYGPFLQAAAQLEALSVQRTLRRVAKETIGRPWADMRQDARGRRALLISDLSRHLRDRLLEKQAVLWLDDIHDADIGSLFLLSNLVDISRGQLAIVCTGRHSPSPGDPAAAQLLEGVARRSSQRRLRGLRIGEGADLIRNVIGAGQISDEEERSLWELTRGNPLFLRELAKHVQESGQLARRSARDAIDHQRLPDSLVVVIDRRVAGLPRNALGTLSLAAAIGDEFSVELVATASSMDPPLAQDELQVAANHGILERRDSLKPGYRFSHQLYRSRIYEMMPAGERRSAHRAIALSGQLLCSEEEIAHHFALSCEASLQKESVRHCRRAAERAELVLAYETAARYWELALGSVRPRCLRERTDVLKRLGWACWAAGNWDRAIEAWSEAIRLSELRIPRDADTPRFALALGEMHRWRVEVEDADRWLEFALSLDLDPNDKARALALLGSTRCLRDDPSEGVRLLAEAERLLGGEDSDPLISYWVSYGHMVSGNSERARVVAADGLDDAKKHGKQEAIPLLAGSLFHHELGRLHVREAGRLAKLVRSAGRNADSTALAQGLVCDSLLAAYVGDWHRVIRLCRRWIQRMRLAGHYQFATATFLQGQASAVIGESEGGIELMLRALPDLERMQPTAAMHVACAFIDVDRARSAEALAEKHADALIGTPRAVAGRIVLGDVASRLDNLALAERCYNAIAGESRHMVMVYRPVSVQRVLGRLAAHIADWPSAVAHFDSTLVELAAGGALWELGHAYFDYAEMRERRGRRGDSRKADALRAQGEEIFARLAAIRPAQDITKRPANRFALTSREIEVLGRIGQGMRNSEIASALSISPRTVARHLQNILMKMDATNRTDAVMKAVAAGLTGPLAVR